MWPFFPSVGHDKFIEIRGKVARVVEIHDNGVRPATMVIEWQETLEQVEVPIASTPWKVVRKPASLDEATAALHAQIARANKH